MKSIHPINEQINPIETSFRRLSSNNEGPRYKPLNQLENCRSQNMLHFDHIGQLRENSKLSGYVSPYSKIINKGYNRNLINKSASLCLYHKENNTVEKASGSQPNFIIVNNLIF